MSQAQAPKKPLLPPSRIAVIVFAVVAMVVIVLEMRTRSQWDRTYKAIQKKFDEDDSGEGIDKSVAENLIQGSPTREATNESELFVWSGILNSYKMRLRYAGDKVISLSQE